MYPASLWEKKRKKVICNACVKKCVIEEGKKGYCQTRINKGNKIYTLLYNNVVGLNKTNIEYVPLFHVLPGTQAISLTLSTKELIKVFNKEWVFLQKYLPQKASIKDMNYEKLIKYTISQKCKTIVFDYVESALAIDYAVTVARTASRYLLKTILATNGYLSYGVIKNYYKYIDGFLVGVKASLDEEFYKKYDPIVKDVEIIKDNLRAIRKRFVHFEVVNLIIPGIGDKEEKCVELAEFLVDLDPEIPLHLVAFFPDDNFPDIEPTSLSTLERLAEKARLAGLRYVYISNLPDTIYLNTFCPNCQEILIKREVGQLIEINLNNNRCPYCGFKIKIIS